MYCRATFLDSSSDVHAATDRDTFDAEGGKRVALSSSSSFFFVDDESVTIYSRETRSCALSSR